MIQQMQHGYPVCHGSADLLRPRCSSRRAPSTAGIVQLGRKCGIPLPTSLLSDSSCHFRFRTAYGPFEVPHSFKATSSLWARLRLVAHAKPEECRDVEAFSKSGFREGKPKQLCCPRKNKHHRFMYLARPLSDGSRVRSNG